MRTAGSARKDGQFGNGVATHVMNPNSIANASALAVKTSQSSAHPRHRDRKEVNVRYTAISSKILQLHWQKSAQCKTVVMCISELLIQEFKPCTILKCTESQETQL